MSPKPNRLCLRAVDFTPVGDAERSEQENDGRTLEGYAAVFDTPTEINSWEGKFSESIARGAFRKTIRERKPVLQFDHGHDARTGSVPIGKFEDIREDESGLFVSARLFDNPVVEPIRQAIEGGAISGMSFRFKVVRDEWRDADGKRVRDDELGDLLWQPGERGPLQRTIKEVQLFEAGPVVFPAYPETSVGVRSMSEEDREALLEQYRRTIVTDDDDGEEETREELPTEDDAASDEGTSSEERENPDDAAPEGTSSGHAKETTPVRTKEVRTPETRKERVPMETMTIEERAARQSEIRSRLSEIDSEFSGAVLPDETQAEWDSLRSEYDEHEAAIEAAQARAEQLSHLAGEERTRERGSDRGARPMRRRPDNIYDLNEIRNSARSQDEYASLLRDNAMRAVDQGKFPGAPDKAKAQEQVERLLHGVDDEEGTLARRILATGSPTYERAFGKALKNLSTQGLNAEEQRALSLGNPFAGAGLAVPYQLDPTVILTSDGSINPLRGVSRVVSIVGKEWQGITSAGITVSRDDEATQVGDDSPTLAQPTVRPGRVQGFVQFSYEADQDWGALRDEMTMLLRDAKEQEEATAFVTGNGTFPNPEGLLTGATTTLETATASTFVAADVYSVEEALPPRFRARGRFMGNKAVYNAVRQFDTNGGAQLWERIGAGQPAELLGYPAHELSTLSGDMGAGDELLVFGDFSQFLIVDRVGMSVELVPQIFGANQRPTGQRGIYAIWRNGSKVLVPGAFRVLVVNDGV